jgi:N-acetylmuramoyl-L-alanine amidase
VLSAEPLPPRPAVLSLAQGVEADAQKEGAGARATELHALAGALFERAWRTFGLEQDAREAAIAYGHASEDLRIPGACTAGEAAALLAGEVARDASTTYTELYRLHRRGVPSAADAGVPGASAECLRRVEARMRLLTPFRPAPRVLEAVDQALSTQGLLGPVASAAPAVDQGPARVLRVEHWPGKESARVVVVLSQKGSFRAGDEAGPSGGTPRVFVDLDGVEPGAAAREIVGSGLVTRVSTQGTTTGTRVWLDVDGPAYRRTFFLLEPYRVVIDVARHPPGALARRRLVTRVVLDPGHGGNDAGAMGPTGVREKDVTLDIAHLVAPILAKDGIHVTLTRDDDRYVTLEERTARANQVGADLFVSIHCNAAENHARHGVETYVLDTTKDDIAARVAARENATSQAATAELGSILASLRLADQATHSNRLAELLQRSALASLKPSFPDVLDGGVHPAGFYVLVGARMPAVLFETSYVSNPTEEQRLASDAYKRRLADAIANAIRAYREGR